MYKSIWKASDINFCPTIEIKHWQVIEFLPSGKRILIGYNATEHEGRISSQIIEYDKLKRKVKTKSGREYYLIGSCGDYEDAWYVFNTRFPTASYRIVSEEYL